MNETTMAGQEQVGTTSPPEFVVAPTMGVAEEPERDPTANALCEVKERFGQNGDEKAAPQTEVERLDTGLYAIPRQELIDRLKKCKSIGQHTAVFIANSVEEFAQLRSDLLVSDLPEEEKAQMNLSTAADLLKIVGIGEIRANRIAAEFGLPEIDSAKSNPPERPEDVKSDDQSLAEAVAQNAGVEIDVIRQELLDDQLEDIHRTNMFAGDVDIGGKVENRRDLPEESPGWPEDMSANTNGSRSLGKLRFRERVDHLIRGDIRGFFESNQQMTEQEEKDFSLVEDPELVSLTDFQLKEGKGPELKNGTPDVAYQLAKEPSDFDLQPSVPRATAASQETTNQADYLLTEIQTKIDRSSLPAPKKTWLRNALLTVAAAFTLNSAVDQVARPLFDAAPIVQTGDMAATPVQEDQSEKEPQFQAVSPSLEPVPTQQQEPVVTQEPRHWWEKWLAPKAVAPEAIAPEAATVTPVEEPAESEVSEMLPAPTEESETAPVTEEFETITLRDALWNYIDKSLVKSGVEAGTAKLNAIKGLTQALNRIAGLDVDFSRVGNVNSFSVLTRVDQLNLLPLSPEFSGTGLVIGPDAMVNLSGLFDLPESSSVESDKAAHEILAGLGSGSLLPENLTQDELNTVLKQALSVAP